MDDPLTTARASARLAGLSLDEQRIALLAQTVPLALAFADTLARIDYGAAEPAPAFLPRPLRDR